MSTTDPKGYYACLGVEPWATADQIRAAFHRCAKLYHPDHNPSSQAKARFQAINEAYRTLGNPQQRAAYDSVRRAGAPNKTDLGPARWRRTELDVRLLVLSSKRLAQFVGVGVLGLIFLVLLLQFAVGPGGPELAPAASSSPPSPFATLPAIVPQGSRSELSPQPPVQVHTIAAAVSALSLLSSHPSTASISPRPVRTEDNFLSGAWLLRDLSNSKTALNLLAREEAVRLQEQLVGHLARGLV